MVKIRLARGGRTHDPRYRIVVSDSRKTPRSESLDQIGSFNPVDGSFIIKEEKALEWLAKGAQASQSVLTLLKKAGIYAKFLASKPAVKKEEKVSHDKNKTSGKEKAKTKANKEALKAERVARHKAKRLEKRADKQPVAEEAAAE